MSWRNCIGWLTSLLVPADLIHEATHMVVAAPIAADVGFERTGMGAVARLEWDASTPTIWIRLAHLAPTIVGSAMGVLAVAMLPLLDRTIRLIGSSTATTLGVPGLEAELTLLIALCALINWTVYVWPSHGDLRPFETAEALEPE